MFSRDILMKAVIKGLGIDELTYRKVKKELA